MRIRQVRLRLLLALIVLAASLPIAALTVSLLLRFWNDQVASAERGNVETARAISISVDQEVESAIAALNVMATLDVFDAWQLPRFQDAALRLVGQRPGWLGLILVDPAGRVLVETDSPYLSPMPVRGKRNEPAHVVHTANCLAGLLGLTLESLADTTTRNAATLFRLAGT